MGCLWGPDTGHGWVHGLMAEVREFRLPLRARGIAHRGWGIGATGSETQTSTNQPLAPRDGVLKRHEFTSLKTCAKTSRVLNTHYSARAL